MPIRNPMRHALRALRLALIAAALIGCSPGGAPAPPGSIQHTINQHTQCPAMNYLEPRWLPDGESILYTAGVYVVDIHQINPDGTGDRVLAGDAYLMSLSPDGGTLMFARRGAGGSGHRDYYLLDLASGQEQVAIHGVDAAIWSPLPNDPAILHAVVAEDSGTLSITGLDGSGVRTLTADPIPGMLRQPRPVWSPGRGSPGSGSAGDGAWIAFDGTFDGEYRAMIIPASGGDPVPVLPPDDGLCPDPIPEVNSAQVWLPDSSGLLVTRTCNNASLGLMVASPDGQITGAMPDVLAYSGSLEWSPDGTQLLYVERVDGVPQVMLADADGSNVRLLAANSDDAHWSGDGKSIIFVERSPARIQSIRIIDADGTNLRTLVTDPNAGQICWR